MEQVYESYDSLNLESAVDGAIEKWVKADTSQLLHQGTLFDFDEDDWTDAACEFFATIASETAHWMRCRARVISHNKVSLVGPVANLRNRMLEEEGSNLWPLRLLP